MLGRWIGEAADSSLNKDALSNNENFIKRDTTVLLHSKFGTDASAATVACHFRVVNIYEKYCKKWFTSKQSFKKWKCEAKTYKLEMRMLKKNAPDEYTDEELCGGLVYRDDEICKVVENEAILNVVRKLQQHVVVP